MPLGSDMIKQTRIFRLRRAMGTFQRVFAEDDA
jgi:hypothetical protein